MRAVLTDCPPCSPGVDIPGSVDSNPLDKAQLPPIAGPPSPPAQMTNGRPKTSNPNFRDPRKLPKLISSSGSATETKYRQETLPEEEEETTAPAGGEQEENEEENEEEADADDEAELTDVREDKEGSEIKPQETTEEEVKQDLASTLGIFILLTVKLRRKVVELINSIEMSEPVTAPTESVEPQSETKEEAEETESAESNSNQPEEKQEDKAEAAADNEKNERAVEEKKEELNLPSSGPQGETTQLLTDIKTDLTHYKIFQVV